MDFHPKSESELASFEDDAIIEYISAARDSGDQEQMRTALGIFVFRRYDQIVNRIRLKVDSDQDVEDLTMRVISDVMTAKFEGEHVGEAVNLMTTIVKRRIADFYESRNKRQETPLPGNADEDQPTPELSTGEDFTRGLELAEITREAVNELSGSHSMVVQLSLTGLRAEEVASRVNESLILEKPMTGPNVHQITKRFRDKITGILQESER